MGGKQFGFGDYEQSTAKKQTKREKFLAEMEQVVPRQPLLDSPYSRRRAIRSASRRRGASPGLS